MFQTSIDSPGETATLQALLRPHCAEIIDIVKQRGSGGQVRVSYATNLNFGTYQQQTLSNAMPTYVATLADRKQAELEKRQRLDEANKRVELERAQI